MFKKIVRIGVFALLLAGTFSAASTSKVMGPLGIGGPLGCLPGSGCTGLR